MTRSLLSRIFARLLLSEPVLRRASGTLAQGALKSLAEQTGRTDLLPKEPPSAAEPLPAPAPIVAVLFQEAKQQAEQGGSVSTATRMIEKALTKVPDDVACLTLAVMILTMSGNRVRAEYFGRRAAALAPRVPAVHINLGNCLRDQQKYEEALKCYRTALDLTPSVIQIPFNMAQCLSQLNRVGEAKEFYQRTLLVPAPTLQDQVCRASALLTLDRLREAESLLDQVLEAMPTHTQALMDLASLYRRTHRHQLAKTLLDRLSESQPSNAMVHMNLSGLHYEKFRYPEALEAARRAYSLDPREPSILLSLASALTGLGQPVEAEVLARQAIGSRHGRPANILAVILEQQCRFDESLEILKQLIAEDTDKAWPHFTMAVNLLRRGDLERGWPEFEWRWKLEQNPETLRDFGKPRWSSGARKGSRILVWAEQGLGDSIQCLRFVEKLSEAGFEPIVEIQESLVRLARQNLACQSIARGEPLPSFDYQIPFLSLPGAFAPTPAAIPFRHSYLKPDPVAAAEWRKRIAPDDRLLVGLHWTGNQGHANDRTRSMPFATLAPLLDLAGIRFISLQKELREGDDISLATGGGGVETQWIAECRDFADTAALIANLDLVIGVDSSVIHLAGALGVPAWLLLPFCPDWRWLTGTEKSIWYDSLRLFRQASLGDWKTAIQSVVAELGRFHAGEAVSDDP